MARNSFDLRSYTVDQLVEIRADIDSMLSTARRELLDKIAQVESFLGLGNGDGAQRSGRKPHPAKGKAVPPKYIGPNGEGWAGRGARPRWLAALLAEGHDIEEFAVGKSVAAAKKSPSKKSARKRK